MSSVSAPLPRASKPSKKDDLVVVPNRRRWLRVGCVLAAVGAVAILFGMVTFQAIIVTNQTTLDDLDARIDQAERQNARLRLEVAELEAPDRIRAMALALGMVKPDDVRYLEPLEAHEVGTPLLPDAQTDGEAAGETP